MADLRWPDYRWSAFILYAYTNEIQFCKLKSQRTTGGSEPADDDFIPCSPKSMYKFADYVGDSMKSDILLFLTIDYI
jgi:hypothetical protein